MMLAWRESISHLHSQEGLAFTPPAYPPFPDHPEEMGCIATSAVHPGLEGCMYMLTSAERSGIFMEIISPRSGSESMVPHSIWVGLRAMFVLWRKRARINLHCFFTCWMAVHAWNFARTMLHKVARSPATIMLWPNLSWEQCVFGESLLLPLQHLFQSWTLMRGAILWVLWIQSNQFIFHHHRWSSAYGMQYSTWLRLHHLRLHGVRSISLGGCPRQPDSSTTHGIIRSYFFPSVLQGLYGTTSYHHLLL